MSETLVLQKLGEIEKEIRYIKENMLDADSIMTEEDFESLLDYRKEKKAGKLIFHADVKKELGM
ncbi:MAG: hypothetical protein AABW68_03595 [archaeon]